MTGLGALRLGLVALFCAVAMPAIGQERSIPPQVLTISTERLFVETAFGDRLTSLIEEDARALARENRQIEAELTAEERELTEQRPTVPVAEFQVLAEAFDAKVQRIRAEQDAKSRDIQTKRDAGRQQFLSDIIPILSEIVRERGALVILDRRDVFLSADSVDITDEAIRRINAALGDGSAAEGD
jgi:Skp family chaperone for outer membrane proteins